MLNSVTNPPFTAPASRTSCHAPESRLMLAVLQDALDIFQRGLNTSSSRDIAALREVDRWFRGDDCDSPFSFETICSTLGLAPRCILDGLNRMKVEAFTNRSVPRKLAIPRERPFQIEN